MNNWIVINNRFINLNNVETIDFLPNNDVMFDFAGDVQRYNLTDIEITKLKRHLKPKVITETQPTTLMEFWNHNQIEHC